MFGGVSSAHTTLESQSTVHGQHGLCEDSLFLDASMCHPPLGQDEVRYGKTPVQCSISESFFEWLQTRQNQEAAQNILEQDAEEAFNIDPEDQAVEVEHGDLSILEQREGRRSWRIYRPTAARNDRPMLLELEVARAMNMRQIRHAIFRKWPDLTFLDRQWGMVEVHESVRDSHLVPEGVECFLLWTEDETPLGHTVTLNEYQRWRIQMKTVASGLVPKIMRKMNDISNFLYFPDETHRCYSRPCTLRINGLPIDFPQIVDIAIGSYLVNADFDRSETVRSTTGPFHQDNYLEQRSTGFERLVGLQMGIATGRRHADFHLPARLFQESLTRAMHHLWHLQKGDNIAHTKVTLVAAPAHQRPDRPQGISIFSYDLGLSVDEGFPSLIEELVLQGLTEDHWSKFFLIPQIAIRDSLIPQTGQTIVLRPHETYQPKNSLVIEVLAMGAPGEVQLEPVDMMMVFSLSPVGRTLLLRLAELAKDCEQLECLLLLNGRYVTEQGEFHWLPDGSFMQILVWMDVQHEIREDLLVQTQEIHEGIQEETHSNTRARTRSRTPRRSFTGNDYMPGTASHAVLLQTFLVCFIFGRKGEKTEEQIAHNHSVTGHHSRSRSWGMRMLLILALLPMVSTLQVLTQVQRRVGEAANPGPDFWLGTVNPTGMRGKEGVLVDLPQGVWGVTETHLSGVNMRSVTNSLKRAAAQQHRSLQCINGAPLPLRARSQSAGTWAGVMTYGDALLRNVQVNWPAQEYQQGRVQVVQAWCGPFNLLGACMYGWAKSPTWPYAIRDTNRLMQTLVQEIGISRGGPRFILGDFNRALEDIAGWKVLQEMGWKDAQDLANELWDQDYKHTCKGKTITDHVLLSPELINLVREVDTWEWFADHAALGVRLALPCSSSTQTVWSLPGAIPWEDIDYDRWYHATRTLPDRRHMPLDQRVQQLAKDYEDSFTGYGKFQSLPNHLRGRCQRLAPETRDSSAPLLKPSRPGEVTMGQEMLGRAVQKWFMHLRRLQSLVHSVRAGKMTAEAILYRVELWSAICRAKGFEGGFRHWWRERPTKAAGICDELPLEPPGLFLLEGIFHDFEVNYRKFECWHARQRRHLLQLQYARQTTKIFEVVRKEPKGGINYLEKKLQTTVATTEDDGSQIGLADNVPQDIPLTISSGGLSKPATAVNSNTVTIEDECLVQHDAKVEVTCHYTTPKDIQNELGIFWKQKWWQENPPGPEEWDRILSFARAYLPPGASRDLPLSLETWVDINKRYGPRSARGPDGIDRRDLAWAPSTFQQELVDILNECESHCYWPKAWRKGFVHSLAKKEGAVQATDFRPVIIYSMVYRSWSSARAKTFLQFLAKHANDYQFGFLPGKEPAEMWLATQAMIEIGVQQKESLAGFITDIRKAFECLPREPIKLLSQHLGLPTKAVALWYQFLTDTERHFVVQGEIGPGHSSNSGYPEGCALSCCAMVIAGLALHEYMRVFSGSTLTLSFVDNIELLAEQTWNLQQAIICLQTWADMWKLELDVNKSFTWAIDPKQRQEVSQLGWQTETGAKDLGAQMAYGSRKTVQVQKARISSLDSLWPRLKHCMAPGWQKAQLIYVALWPKAFYGISVCTLGWGHIKTLRTTVMKTMGWAKAGSNAGLRLGILNDSRVDPGFYQALQVLTTFRRLAGKQPGLLDQWTIYMEHYSGQTYQGPFAKLLEICHQLRWQIEVPHVRDRHGTLIQWLDMSDKSFFALVKEAWTWKIWEEVQTRQDMTGLYGIDSQVITAARRKIPMHLKESIAVLQSGTFVESRIHAKYDLTKDAKCPLCGQDDSLEHRCRECPMMTDTYTKHSGILGRWDLFPVAKRLRLLPSANPHLEFFRRAIATQEDRTVKVPLRQQHTMLHLFTDGSCIGGTISEYALGAWAVISPQEDQCVAKGCLGGHTQSGDRAELKAAVTATEIGIDADCAFTIWTDSTYVADGFLRILHDPMDVPDTSNHDLWLELQGFLLSRSFPVHIQHVPGHSPVGASDNDCIDWAARWNDRADREAQRAQRMHAEALRHHHALWAHHEQELCDLCDLQLLHLDICEHYTSTHQPDDEDSEEVGYSPEDLKVERGCPDSPNPLMGLDFMDQTGKTALESQFGRRFVSWMLTWLIALSSDPDVQMVKLSYLEIAIFVGKEGRDHLPRVHPYKPNCWCDSDVTGASEPTLGATLRCLRTFLTMLEQCFSLSLSKWTGLNLTRMGVHTPMNGITFPATEEFLQQTTRSLLNFTFSRPIRVTNDLARPLRD